MKTLVVVERAGDCWRLEEWAPGARRGRDLGEGSQDHILRLAADCLASSTRAGVRIDPEIVILPRTAAEWYGPTSTWRPRPVTELTPIGEQYVIPGCERRETARGERPTQSSLWDVAE